MTPVLSTAEAQSAQELVKAVRRDPESLLQLLLAMCKKRTLSRIIHCPTYPVRVVTPDLQHRIDLVHQCLSQDPYSIAEILGILYESAVDPMRRKTQGQYFTEPHLANKAVALLGLKLDDTVIDPGCGTGAFAVAILENCRTHRQSPSVLRYLGVENDLFLALSTALSLDLVEAPLNWRVLYEDFLSMTSQVLEQLGYPRVDAIVANPPFVRYHRINNRKILCNRVQERSSLPLSQLSGLHHYFLAQSYSLVRRDGRMVFLLPPETEDVKYGSRLLGAIESRFDRKNLRVAELRPNNGSKRGSDLLVHVFMQKSNATGGDAFVVSKTTHFAYLGTYASVHRGISTGANWFFVLTDALAHKVSIPEEYLEKVIPPRVRLPEVISEETWRHFKDSGQRCWLLSIPKGTLLENLPGGVRQYLRLGEKEGVHLTATCNGREPWYCVPSQGAPDFVFTYMSRGHPRFLLNEVRARILNNLLGVCLARSFSSIRNRAEVRELLTESLSKWIRRDHVGRRYSGGLVKFEPNDLRKMPISKEVALIIAEPSRTIG